MTLQVSSYNSRLEQERICHHCPMENRGVFVGVDSSSGLVEKRSVMFLGLNPGNEEARIGLPFVGPSGKFLRSHMKKGGINSWVMANSLLCSTSNESEIPEGNRARECCRRNLAAIFQSFSPEIVVPCGNGAWSLFATPMGISQACGHVFVSRGRTGKCRPVLVLPLIHPSALIRSGGESSPKFPAFMERLRLIGLLEQTIRQADPAAAMEWLSERGISPLPCFTKKF